jgi:tetratricopeptide (TPR) repeat protein
MERKKQIVSTAFRGAAALAAALLVAAEFWGCAKEARQPAEKVYLHKVEEGETVSDVADEYYGDPQRASAIEKFNGLEDESVPPGTVLRVPMSDADIGRLATREKARVSYNKGLELVQKAAYVDAVTEFESALSVDPGFADARYNLGVTLQMLKSYDRAKEQLEKAVELRPKNTSYQFALGTALFHLDEFSRACSAFEAVLESDVEDTKALYSLAVCYEKLGEKDKAIAAWERYLELDATSGWAAEARKRLDALK